MADKKKIKELLVQAADANLDGLDFLQQFTFEQLAEGYNGIGPEFLNPLLRKAITKFLKIFQAPALVHDMRNEYSDGTREGFHDANNEFLRNCLKCADFYYADDKKRRDRARVVAYTMFAFVSSDSFGWRAWLEAKERHERKNVSSAQPTPRRTPCLCASA